MASVLKSEVMSTNNCNICLDSTAKYSCPRCHIYYCSLECYRSEKHLLCSEEFYKNCLLENLPEKTETETKQKILEILQKQHEETGGIPDLDSDDNDSIPDLSERLNGINLDNPDDIWQKLTDDEKQEFVAFISTKDASKLIEPWKPWWQPQGQPIIQEMNDLEKDCPAHVVTPPFTELTKKTPSQCVRHNISNILYAYSFVTRYFNGEHTNFFNESTACLYEISTNLKMDQIFTNDKMALESVKYECMNSDWITTDVDNFFYLNDDLNAIVSGPLDVEKNFYILSALSDCYYLIEKSLKQSDCCEKNDQFIQKFPSDYFPQMKMPTKKRRFIIIKKLIYFISYIRDLC